MSNKNYDQVTDLLAQGQLRWDIDAIAALLVKNAVYTSSDQRLSALGATYVTSAPIQGRWIGEHGMAMGLPAVFNKVAGGEDYQVLVVKDDGRSDPLLLSFIDQNTDGDSIVIQHSGSLIVRPNQDLQVNPLLDPPQPPAMPTAGVWMVLA